MVLDYKFESLYSLGKIIYHVQFTTNFVIYAASNRLYREAYVLFIKEGICRVRQDEDSNSQQTLSF